MRGVKWLWLLVVMLLIVPLASNVVHATMIHDCVYVWYSSGGTVITELDTGEQWTKGDVISGDPWYQLVEKVFDWPEAKLLDVPDGVPEGSNLYDYILTRVGAEFGAPEVFDMHIYNVYGAEGVGSVPFPYDTYWQPEWSGYTDPPQWSWRTPLEDELNSLPANGSRNKIPFQTWSPAPWGYVSGYPTGIVGYDEDDNPIRGPIGNGYEDPDTGQWISTEDWVISGPVPEPGTLLLLGSGLVGLAGYSRLRLKRKKS